MKLRVMALAFGVMAVTSGPIFASAVIIGEHAGVVGMFGRDYKYFNIADPQPGDGPGVGWATAGFDHSGWAVGESVFSNVPAIDAVPQRTFWAANTDMYLYKEFYLSSPIDMTALTAADNGYEIFVNGVSVASGNAEGFTSHWEYTDSISASYFVAGLNTIAFHLEDHGGATAWDFALVGEISGVPEPTSIAMWSVMGGIGFMVRRKRRKTQVA